jgi:glycerol uptake facilitator-like aquaporin
VTDWDAFQIEIVVTAIFALVCLLNKTGKTKPTQQGLLSALAVSLTLMGLLSVTGNSSGGCLNPAVGLSMQFWAIANTTPDSRS